MERKLGPRAKDDKYVYLDIAAKDESGRLVEIEVQNYRHPGFRERSLFYWSQLYSRQLHSRQEYHELKPVICVNLLAVSLFPGEKWYTIDRLAMTDHLQLHFIDLTKLPAVWTNDAEKWAWFLMVEGRDLAAAAELAAGDEMIAAVHRRYGEYMSIDGNVLRALAREREQRDQRSLIYYAKTEGREEGREEGQAEKAVEIAAALARKGVDSAIIKETTGIDLTNGV